MMDGARRIEYKHFVVIPMALKFTLLQHKHMYLKYFD